MTIAATVRPRKTSRDTRRAVATAEPGVAFVSATAALGRLRATRAASTARYSVTATAGQLSPDSIIAGTVRQPFEAVLVIAFGGPGGPDDIRPFLANVLRG